MATSRFGLPLVTLADHVRFSPLFDCIKHSLAPDAEAYATEHVDQMTNSEFLTALSAALSAMLSKEDGHGY